MGKRRALAGRADRHQPVRARGDLPVDQRAKAVLVDPAVLERRDERRSSIRETSPAFPSPARLVSRPHPVARRRTHSPGAAKGSSAFAILHLGHQDRASSRARTGRREVRRPASAVAAPLRLRGRLMGISAAGVAALDRRRFAQDARRPRLQYDRRPPFPPHRRWIAAPRRSSPGRRRAISLRRPRPRPRAGRPERKEAKVQFAYASFDGAAPALGAQPAVMPPAETPLGIAAAPPARRRRRG